MAFRDLMHRSAVYFGLAEERYDDDYDEPRAPVATRPNPEAEIEERYRERPNVRRMPSRRRRDEIDDIFGDPEEDRRTNVLRSVRTTNGGGSNGGRGEVRVHFVVPENFNDAQDVGNKFKDSIPVILNLQGVDPGLSIRIIDFASGLTYALDGGMQKIAEKTFLLTPRNVEVSAEEKARLMERGFFNQS